MGRAQPRLGTRGSKLALVQAEWVAERLGGAEVVVVKTEDAAVGDKARFVRGIEEALLAGEVDVAVHSAKDLPVDLPDGLEIAAVPPREDPADAWIGGAEIGPGARVGTSSLRRRAQLLARDEAVNVDELRGNIDTRLEKLDSGDLDGIVLAAAGLRRLGLENRIGFRFPEDEMTPAAGQGALALEVRGDDERAKAALNGINDKTAAAELAAERAAVAELGGSCNTPIGIRGRLDEGRLRLAGFAGLPDGSEWVRDSIEAEASDPAAAGLELAERMNAAGAADILRRAGEPA